MYILIIPGFGIVSQVVSAFAGKPVFGQDGPYIGYQCYATHYMRERKIIQYCTRVTVMLVLWSIAHSVIINIELANPQETNALFGWSNTELSMLVGSSETVRVFSTSQSIQNLKVQQWIAGVIDGKGHFRVSKNGSSSLEIIIIVEDIPCLYKFKNRYGGSVKHIGYTAEYRLHHIPGMIKLVTDVNGLLYNSIKPFAKICSMHDIQFITSKPLEYNSGYLSGLLDSNGKISINLLSGHAFISIYINTQEILNIVSAVYGGKVYSTKTTIFKWVVHRKADNLSILHNYFHWYGCISPKMKRINMLEKYYWLYSLEARNATLDSVLGKYMLLFKEKWNMYDSPD